MASEKRLEQFFEEEECLVCHNTRQVPDTDHEDSGSGISEDEVMKDCECKIRRDEKIRLAMMTNMSIKELKHSIYQYKRIPTAIDGAFDKTYSIEVLEKYCKDNYVVEKNIGLYLGTKSLSLSHLVGCAVLNVFRDRGLETRLYNGQDIIDSLSNYSRKPEMLNSGLIEMDKYSSKDFYVDEFEEKYDMVFISGLKFSSLFGQTRIKFHKMLMQRLRNERGLIIGTQDSYYDVVHEFGLDNFIEVYLGDADIAHKQATLIEEISGDKEEVQSKKKKARRKKQ